MKLPSLPPPTEAPSRSGQPSSAATSWARAKIRLDESGSKGGRLAPPFTSRLASGRATRSRRTLASTRSASAAVANRTSMSRLAWAGITLVRVPAWSRVGDTVVPSSGRPSAATSATSGAIARSEFTPRSGSNPAWAARPCTVRQYPPIPFRAILTALPSGGSSTSTAEHSLASASIRSREASLPTSSSPVSSRVKPPCGPPPCRSPASAARATTTPPFMSKTPGPWARLPETSNSGCQAPMSQTVSR